MLALWALLFWSTGCTNLVHPPGDVSDPVTVYVADHGKHSSILLPVGGDVAAGGYVQYAYGDWRAFVENDNSWRSYLRAAFVSRKSALGRRVHHESDPAKLRRRIAAARLESVTVERAAADSLRSELEAAWHSRDAEAVENPLVRLTLVPYEGPNWRYSLLNHCNHTTARWLRRLDCGVWRPAMLSDFRVVQAH